MLKLFYIYYSTDNIVESMGVKQRTQNSEFQWSKASCATLGLLALDASFLARR